MKREPTSCRDPSWSEYVSAPGQPGVGFLSTLEGFGFVSGWTFPNRPFVGARPVLIRLAGNGLDIPADSRDDFPVSPVVVAVSFAVFYQSRERDAPAPNRTLIGKVIAPRPGTYALILLCASNARIQIGRLGKMHLQTGYYVYLGSAFGPGGLNSTFLSFLARNNPTG